MRAGFLIRLIAFISDLILLTLVFVAAGYGLTAYYSSTLGMTFSDLLYNVKAGAFPLALLLAMALWLVYFLSELLIGVTAGKLLCGLRIARDDSCSAPVARLAVRFLLRRSAEILFFAGLLFNGLPLLRAAAEGMAVIIFISMLLALESKRTTLYDRWTSTAVYPKEEIGSAADSIDPSVPRIVPARTDPENLLRPRW